MKNVIKNEEIEALEKVVKKIKRPLLKEILSVQQQILRSIDEFMIKENVTRVMPLMMAPITDTLNHDVEETELNYCGQKFDVMKSMIFHKQLILMNEGLEKIYIVSPNIRLERPERNDTRHLFEFSQVDFEFKNAKMDDILAFIEKLVSYVFSDLKEKCAEEIINIAGSLDHLNITKSFDRYRTEDLYEKYGEDFEKIASEKATEPFFLINHKREFYDKEDLNKPGTYLNYDLIWPRGYVEGLSGGEREFEYERILVRMDEIGQSRELFRNYIEIAKRGLLPQTAGAGLGVERITRYVLQLKGIDDVTIFNRKPGETPYIF